jgi:O-antigen/teichoic acid export membrane protein
MTRAVLIGWLARLLAIVLSLVNTRLLVDLVGVSGLAAHAIVASLFVWLALLSFGLPSGMQSLVSEWRARGLSVDDLRDTVSSLAAVVFFFAIPIAIIVAVLTRNFLLVDYPFVSVWAVVAACLSLSLAAVGGIFGQMLHAEHRSVWPNMFPAMVAIAVCGILLMLKALDRPDFNLLLSLYFLPSAAIIGFALYQLRLPQRWLLDRKCIAALWGRSRAYLLASFLGTVTLNLDYLILSRLLSDNDLAAYNLASRFFLVLLSVHAVLLASAWTPMGEMFYGREYDKLRKYIWKLLSVGLVLGVCGGGAIVVMMPALIGFLAGSQAPDVPLVLVALWWTFMLIRIWSDTFFAILQSFGRADLLNRYIPFQAVISASLQVLLGNLYGAEGVLIGIILSFFMTSVWYLPKHGFRLISGLSNAKTGSNVSSS